jgi:hypothetical protein
LAKRLQDIKDNTDVSELQKHREEIESKSRAIKASTEDITKQHRDLESSLAMYTSQIDEKNKALASLQQKSIFLNRSAAAFQNVLKQHTATKSRRRDESDRLRELALKEANIIDLTVRLETLKRESAEKDEEEKRMKLKLVELQHRYEIETGCEEDILESEDLTSQKGSMADSLTYDCNDKQSVKSMSVLSQSANRSQDCKYMSMYEGNHVHKFARPSLAMNQSSQPLNESNMSAFELELYNCAKSSKHIAQKAIDVKADISNDSTTMLGKRSMLRSMAAYGSKKRSYVRL